MRSKRAGKASIRESKNSEAEKAGLIYRAAQERSQNFKPYLKGKKNKNVRIGDQFQAAIPDCDPASCLKKYAEEEARGKRQSICLWSGPAEQKMSNDELAKFCKLARHTRNFNEEQALGILYAVDLDSEEAMESLDHYRPMPDQLSERDELIFEQAFALSGTDLRNVKKLLPENSMAEIMQYHYSRKTWRMNIRVYDCIFPNWKVKRDQISNTIGAAASDKMTDDGCGENGNQMVQICHECRMSENVIYPASSALRSISSPTAPVGMALSLADFIDLAPLMISDVDHAAEKREKKMQKLDAKIEQQRKRLEKTKIKADELGFGKTLRQEKRDGLHDISALKKGQAPPKSRKAHGKGRKGT